MALNLVEVEHDLVRTPTQVWYFPLFSEDA